ncbi:MAG: hypothetical protein INQ03_14180 [Candidatus Heimdallarchaeota archaeon]|nr:hypothetical protein [Candidatus Heimdallarchaeota archaeon]
MTDSIDPIQVAATLINLIVVTTITILLIRRKQKLGIKALNILIWVFGSLMTLTIAELIRIFFQQNIPIFLENNDQFPVLIDPIRILNYIFIFTIYIFGEQVVSANFNRKRMVIVGVLTTSILIIGIIDLRFNMLILTSDFIPFANDTRLDEFIFDIYQFFIIAFAFYVFQLQRVHASSPSLKKYALYLQIASSLFMGAMAIEVSEHIQSEFDIDAFISGVPTILVLGYVYVFHPRYIHLVPSEIKFLQIILKGGIPIYAADFDKKMNNIEFLVGPGLFSISTMIGELIESNLDDFHLYSIKHSNGTILFEKVGNLVGVIQTSRDSYLLRSSMQYFLTNFQDSYREDLINFTGILQERNITPDELLVKCMPVVESKQMVSNLGRR